MNYKKTMGSILVKKDNDFYILRNRELFQVNEMGARIFELSNGKNSKQDMLAQLSKIFNMEDTAENDLSHYLSILCDSGLIKEV